MQVTGTGTREGGCACLGSVELASAMAKHKWPAGSKMHGSGAQRYSRHSWHIHAASGPETAAASKHKKNISARVELKCSNQLFASGAQSIGRQPSCHPQLSAYTDRLQRGSALWQGHCSCKIHIATHCCKETSQKAVQAAHVSMFT